MEIQTKYFGKLTDITSCESESVSVKDDERLHALLDLLYIQYPNLKDTLYTVFINNAKAENMDLKLSKYDEVTLMPPFSGG